MGDRWLMLLNNHGAFVCGKTLQDAYIHNHFLELACRAQIGALAGGPELITPSRALCETVRACSVISDSTTQQAATG
jgi:ribulose-5-phosphate 4-epimerase/fuculose-1-phosphate aldolase